MMAWLASPNVIIALFIVIGAVGVWDANRRSVETRVEAKSGQIAAKVNAKAEDTVTKVAAGQAETPPIPEDKKLLQELCDRSASCRSRKR